MLRILRNTYQFPHPRWQIFSHDPRELAREKYEGGGWLWMLGALSPSLLLLTREVKRDLAPRLQPRSRGVAPKQLLELIRVPNHRTLPKLNLVNRA